MIDPLLYALWSFNAVYLLLLMADAGWLEWMTRVRALRWAFTAFRVLVEIFDRVGAFVLDRIFALVTMLVNRTYDLIYWRRS